MDGVPREGKETGHPSTLPCPPHLFPLPAPGFYPLWQKRKSKEAISLSSVRCSVRRQRKSWELLIDRWLLRSAGGPWLKAVIWRSFGVCPFDLWVHGAGISLNCWTPNWCLENWRSYVRKHPIVGYGNIRRNRTSHCEKWGKLQFTLTQVHTDPASLILCYNYCY